MRSEREGETVATIAGCRATVEGVFRGMDPERANDLRDRRARYERRARSIRYGTVRAGSVRHLAQAMWRSLADLRRPTRLVAVAVAVGAICVACAGFGVPSARLVFAAVAALPVVVGAYGVITWFQERRVARRRPGFPALVSPPERPARRARQDS